MRAFKVNATLDRIANTMRYLAQVNRDIKQSHKRGMEITDLVPFPAGYMNKITEETNDIVKKGDYAVNEVERLIATLPEHKRTQVDAIWDEHRSQWKKWRSHWDNWLICWAEECERHRDANPRSAAAINT